MSEREDFYIGYQPRASNATALLMRRLTLVLLVIALLISLVFVLSQQPFAASYFEFGRARGFSGTIIERPLPMVRIPRAGGNSASSYTLVGAGKHGAGGEVAGLEGRTVRLNGTIIHRDGMTMIEVAPGSVRPTDQVPGSVAESPEDLGAAVFSGEIVDS
jgi:hypothetical protein